MVSREQSTAALELDQGFGDLKALASTFAEITRFCQPPKSFVLNYRGRVALSPCSLRPVTCTSLTSSCPRAKISRYLMNPSSLHDASELLQFISSRYKYVTVTLCVQSVYEHHGYVHRPLDIIFPLRCVSR